MSNPGYCPDCKESGWACRCRSERLAKANPPEQPSEAMIEAGARAFIPWRADPNADPKIAACAIYTAMRAATPAPVQDDDLVQRLLDTLYDNHQPLDHYALSAALTECGFTLALATDTALVEERLRHLVRQYVDPCDVAPEDHALALAIGTDDEAGFREALASRGGDNGK